MAFYAAHATLWSVPVCVGVGVCASVWGRVHPSTATATGSQILPRDPAHLPCSSRKKKFTSSAFTVPPVECAIFVGGAAAAGAAVVVVFATAYRSPGGPPKTEMRRGYVP